ncbi:MAG: AraC family transcriptional regulator [Gemmatimonadaceae bacterium]
MSQECPPHAETLLVSPVVEIIDWRCAGRDDTTHSEWSDSFEICVPRRGAFVRETNGVREFLDTTTYAFFSPEEEYRVTHPITGGDHCTVFRLPTSAAMCYLADVSPGLVEPSIVRFPLSSAPESVESHLLQHAALDAARAAHRHGHRGTMLAEEMALDFVRLAIQQMATIAVDRSRLRQTRCEPAPSASVAAEYAMRVRRLVAARFRESLTLATIAAAVGCSPFHLHRMFKRSAGTTIHRYVMRLRLRHALERLLETRLPLAIVAMDAGFASQSHLGDAFRAEFAVSPGSLRQHARGAETRLRHALGVLRARGA